MVCKHVFKRAEDNFGAMLEFHVSHSDEAAQEAITDMPPRSEEVRTPSYDSLIHVHLK